jgi:endoglucanase
MTRNIFYQTFKITFIVCLLLLWSCKKDEVQNTLTVSTKKIEFDKDGSSTMITIKTNAESWNITNPAASWVELSISTGTQQSASVLISVSTKSLTSRSDTLTITAGDAEPVHLIVSQASSEYLYTLTADNSSLTYVEAGSSSNINITTTAPQWSISSNVSWLNFSQATGASGNTSMSITASDNTGGAPRTATVTLSAEFAPSYQILISQKGEIYPSYNTSPIAAEATGMSSNAAALAAKIKIGWNLGNSLEAIGGETAWSNPKTTKALIDLVKQSGFNAVRIPCSWNQYMTNSSTAQLSATWLARVREVIQYCLDNDMYVILNIHWDSGWLQENCTTDKQEVTNAKQKAFWEQIATYMRDFDEHLLFASANEPNVSDATQMAVLKSYHQTFINAVRSTGGKNANRVLVIQGPSTDIETTNKLMLSLPTDIISSRMMVEVHYYTPWNFCGLTADADWGKMFYYWGNGYHSTTETSRNATWGEESTVDANFKLMKNQFVDNGIPVVLGEYSATRRSSLTGDALTNHLASRAYFFKYVTKQAKANGIIPFYWDNGGNDNNSCGLFNRNTNTVFDQQALDALIQGATN